MSWLRFSALLILAGAGTWTTVADRRVLLSRALALGLAAQQPKPANASALSGEAAARVQCAICHKFPAPDVLPRAYWRDEIARMFLIAAGQPEPTGPPGTAARLVSLPPQWRSIAAYYEAAAPEHLAPPETWPAPDRTLPSGRAWCRR